MLRICASTKDNVSNKFVCFRTVEAIQHVVDDYEEQWIV